MEKWIVRDMDDLDGIHIYPKDKQIHITKSKWDIEENNGEIHIYRKEPKNE